MQKTTHWDLNTWAGSDPVSLDQMNENFTKIDAAGAQLGARLTKHDAGLLAAAYHTAHRALESLHADTLGDRRRNLLLADFSKAGQWESLYHLNLVDDLKKPVPAASAPSEWSMTKIEPTGGSVYRASNGLIQTIAEFTAASSGSVQSLLLVDGGSGGDGSTRYLTMLEDGVKVAEGTFTTTSSDYVVKTIDMAFTLTAGKKYTLQLRFPTSSKSFSMGVTTSQSGYAGMVFPLLQGTGTTYASGRFTTPEATVKQGGTLYLWLLHSGTAPEVEVKNNSGAWQTLTCQENEGAAGVAGAAGVRRGYRLDDVAAGSLQLRVTLGSATCIVEEICGAVL